MVVYMFSIHPLEPYNSLDWNYFLNLFFKAFYTSNEWSFFEVISDMYALQTSLVILDLKKKKTKFMLMTCYGL